ncbi:MAG: diguanylate cyclase [Nitrospirota bacterium]
MGKGNILFVEDSKTQGSITKEVIEKNGYAVTWVLEGNTAISKAVSQPFDVILLDRVLPDMDGNEVCKWLKHNQDTKGIPIIMLTSRIATTDKVEGLESGADDYLPKPYEEIELNARIYAAMRTKRLQDELRKRNDEMKEMLAKVETLSITDPLTNLFNRRRFETVLEAEFAKALRYKSSLSCMMIDIDHFKSINDTFGHATGDKVLKNTASIIQQCIRTVDIACRWGGEEFVILAPMTLKAFMITPARRILQSISDYAFPDIEGRSITVSIGIADLSTGGVDNAEKLIQAADMALYEAKKNGRNRIEIKE